jgi:hypothetical protein
MKRSRLAPALALALLGGCSSASVGQVSPQVVNPVSTATLQFAVGTYYNDPSTIVVGSGDANPAINVVATFRNQQGHSAVLTDNVTIFGPQNFVAAAPGSACCDGGATNQVLKSLKGTILFGDGFGLVDTALDANYSVQNPPPGTVGELYPFAAGPPAWPIVTGPLDPQQLTGYPESVEQTPLAVSGTWLAPVAGQWQLQVTVPLGTVNNGYSMPQMNANANLVTTNHLPLFPAPSFVPDGNGGGTIEINVPAGVTEAFVNFTVTNQICYPPPAVQNPEFNQITSNYTVMTRQTGPQTLVLPDNLGPPAPKTGTLLHTMCTTADNQNPLNPNGETPPYVGAKYSLNAVGVDYPAYEMAYPQSTVPNPTIVGANGQADVTVSKSLYNLVYP